MELFSLLYSACLVISTVYCSLTTKYYQDLLLQRMGEVKDYQLPQKNDEFTEGVKSENITYFGHYDFIIVGAGSAGGVLAARLSEISEWNILLLEAGDEEDDFSTIPGMFFYLQFSEKNWGYLSTSQKSCCLGMKDRKCMVPRGKSIGGSSAINGVVYSRGNANDFNKWAELGNTGWSYLEVLPYFIKSENSQINGDAGYHGNGGYWNVEYALPTSEYFKNFVDANAENGQKLVDYNGQNEFGISKTQFNMKRGKRQSTGTAFLDNARKRKNLKVVTKALVTKINIDSATKCSQGVEFVKDNVKFSATAEKEVLLSAGAINSPQLLMLSGIGPKQHLKELNIEVIEDLPVGEHLLDHPMFPGLSFHTNVTHTKDNLTKVINEYLLGFGPLTNNNNLDGIGFINTENHFKDVPEIEYIFVPPAGTEVPIMDRVFNFDKHLSNGYLSQINLRTDITFYIILLHQKSKGRITLKSNDPTDFPNIDFNFFSHPDDIHNLIKGIEFILSLAKTSAFKKLNATLIDIPICQDQEKYSKAFWECAIRHMAVTVYHPCGTTAMGVDKTNSVVDTNLNVHGIKKLRVVDAGVFPSTVSGHTNAPTIMVAEKVADLIKNNYLQN